MDFIFFLLLIIILFIIFWLVEIFKIIMFFYLNDIECFSFDGIKSICVFFCISFGKLFNIFFCCYFMKVLVMKSLISYYKSR